MKDKIVDLISMLSLNDDCELIEMLFSKISKIEMEVEKEMDFEYKYSLGKLSPLQRSCLFKGIEKSIKHNYQSIEEDTAREEINDIEENQCSKCRTYQCDECEYLKKISIREQTIEKHEKIRESILKNLPPDYLKMKLIQNRLNHKLKEVKTTLNF